MALEVQLASQSPSPSPSPSPRESAPDHAPPTAMPTREAGGEWADPEKGELPAGAGAGASAPNSTAIVVASTHHAAAARYVPRSATTHTANPDPNGGEWISYTGARSARRAQRGRRDPPTQRQRLAEEQYPAPSPTPARAPPVPAHAPPSSPPPPPATAPPAAPAQAQAQDRAADRVVPHILHRNRWASAMQCTALLARGAAAGLCLAALAVLAADTRKGWALDSYSNYSQFRYSEAVNVVGFVYSVLQFAALADLMRRNMHLAPRPKRDLFDFTMDQVLAYLLISSSSSATARVADLIDNWGSDPFPSMANGSIAISFLAFVVFAICSLISAYNLFRRDM